MAKTFQYFIAPFLAFLVFSVSFQIWQLDLTMPIFRYGGDSFFHLSFVKNVIDTGWFFSNDLLGHPHIDGAHYLHDFPLLATTFNLFIIKLIACFSSDVFLVGNVFFILTFPLIALTSFIALRSLNITILTAALISVLYAFTPYHLFKNVSHLFLSNYAIIPLIIMVVMWMLDEKIKLIGKDEKGTIILQPNRYFYYALAITIFASINGIYYALYACVTLVFAWFLLSLRHNRFFDVNALIATTLILSIFLALLVVFLEPMTYWMQHGFNHHIGSRSTQDSQTYGLKFYKLFLPVVNHPLEYLRNMRAAFDYFAIEYETGSASLGFISSSALLFLLSWIFAQGYKNDPDSIINKTLRRFAISDEEEKRITNIAHLSLLIILFAMVGGFVMFIAISFPLLRSHARFSIFLAFLTWILVAIIFDKIAAKKQHYSPIFLVMLTLVGLYDQIGIVSAATAQPDQFKTRFLRDKHFIQDIESTAPHSQIFILPVFGFPEAKNDKYRGLIAYLHSKDLRLSYPVIMGRKSHAWQEKVVDYKPSGFINALKEKGFTAILIDRESKAANVAKLERVEKYLKETTTDPALSTSDNAFVFYRL